MSEALKLQIHNEIVGKGNQRDIYHRLLSTAEAAEATGLSEYELRKGEKEGRYPAIWIGGRNASSGKMRWNLDFLNNAIMRQMEFNTSCEEDK